MKRLILVSFLSFSALCAQEAEKMTVPLDDPSRPARLHVQLMTGGISVRGADVNNVTVEVTGRGGSRHEVRERRPVPSKAEGMKRLDVNSIGGFEITERANLVSIEKGLWEGGSNFIITVPKHSSLQLECATDGNIEVENIDGEIDANDLNGNISLNNISGSVLAHSLNGEVKVVLDRIDPAKPMSFSTLNGDIDVTLPGSVKANVVMKTDHGEIYSDFEVKLNSSVARPTEAGRQSNGSYRLRFDHALRGTIAGGGPEFQFTSFNGQIYLRRRK